MRISSTPAEALITRLTYNANGDIQYIGSAAPDSATSDEVWMIMELIYDISFNIILVAYADGNDLFDKEWDDRASYTYS